MQQWRTDQNSNEAKQGLFHNDGRLQTIFNDITDLSAFTCRTFFFYVSTFQQHLHTNYQSTVRYDIPGFVFLNRGLKRKQEF